MLRLTMKTEPHASNLLAVIKAPARDFGEDKATNRAAALCYFTVFALPPLLILLIKVAGLVWSPYEVQRSLEGQFSGIVGQEGAAMVRRMIVSGDIARHSTLASVLGVIGILVGATGALGALQDALNAVWEVRPDPRAGGLKRLVVRRILSLGMIFALGFMLAVSLAITAAISAIGDALGGAGAQVLNIVLSVAILTALFAAMFKFVPDAIVPWRSVWVGGFATAVLFELGKVLIGLYLSHAHPGNAFGAASALAIILVWIYYAGALLLFGAEFTQAFAKSRGHAVQPKKGAVRVERLVVRQFDTEPLPGRGR